MVNFNGNLLDSELQLTFSNRSFLYGDGVFETLKIVDNAILFFEDHYFRLMASMRIVRMEIPMSFTLEFLENQVLSLTSQLGIENSARVRITVYRNEGGYYAPSQNSVSYIIQASPLFDKKYKIPELNEKLINCINYEAAVDVADILYLLYKKVKSKIQF